MLYYSCRTPRGRCESLDPNAFAGCRAYCEACANLMANLSCVDNLILNGVGCRTVSGWKHSSTKVILAGVIY